MGKNLGRFFFLFEGGKNLGNVLVLIQIFCAHSDFCLAFCCAFVVVKNFSFAISCVCSQSLCQVFSLCACLCVLLFFQVIALACCMVLFGYFSPESIRNSQCVGPCEPQKTNQSCFAALLFEKNNSFSHLFLLAYIFCDSNPVFPKLSLVLHFLFLSVSDCASRSWHSVKRARTVNAGCLVS